MKTLKRVWTILNKIQNRSESAIEQSLLNNETFENFLLRHRRDGEFGDNAQIIALQRFYKRRIVVLEYSVEPRLGVLKMNQNK